MLRGCWGHCFLIALGRAFPMRVSLILNGIRLALAALFVILAIKNIHHALPNYLVPVLNGFLNVTIASWLGVYFAFIFTFSK